ncbi:MAG: hypothetical protein HYZ14_12635 [Bacteroidetes bacterium]|nr:hypothetical protein [Bacteroidota bacterium]
MKSIFFSIAIATSVCVNAESIMRDYYVVVSDVFDKTLNPGTCQLVGRTLDVNENPIAGGTVSNFDRSRSCISDETGRYTVLLSSMDTAVFFYHKNYGEVVIWKYNFQSQHRVEINFISMEYSEILIEEEKPVIYLYADEPTQVNLTLKHPALTFTYPAYNNGWSVTTNTAGGLTNTADSKNYPYLFWEGRTENLAFKNQDGLTFGSLIKTNAGIDFLEASLSALGLNSTEMTDFITYWGPRLRQKEYAFVQFLVDDEVDSKIATLQITPEPQNKRRVYMLFTLLDTPQVPFEFEAQQFTGFERSGLTLLEWGGSEINLRSSLP